MLECADQGRAAPADKATDHPKESSAAAPEAVSSPVWDQVQPRSVNTYPAPSGELDPGAPIRAVLAPADKATEAPNWSCAAAWEAVSSAVWDQVTPRRVNTYTAPATPFSEDVPTRAVLPSADKATEDPNPPFIVAEPVSSACWE